MSEPGSITRITPDLHAEDPLLREAAARLIWLRYAQRLEAFVKNRLDPRIRSRIDPRDVAQNVFHLFFKAPRSPGELPRDRTELWRLLMHIARCQAMNALDYYTAECRNVGREIPLVSNDDSSSVPGPRTANLPDRPTPSPAELLAGFEAFDRLMAKLPPRLQAILLMRLEGYTNAEIAGKIHRVERTVELNLKAIRALLGPDFRSMETD